MIFLPFISTLKVKGSTLGDHWGYLFAYPELRLRMYVNHQTSHFLCYAIGIGLSIQLDIQSQRLCYLAILAQAEYSSLSLDRVDISFSYWSLQLPSSGQPLQLASPVLTPLIVSYLRSTNCPTSPKVACSKTFEGWGCFLNLHTARI